MNNRWFAYVTLALAILGWALSPVFIRYLSGAYDLFSQAFIRYVGATLFLFLWVSIAHRGELRRAFAAVGPTVGLALTNVFVQVTWTYGFYHTTATIGQLIVKLQVPMTLILCFLLFREERAIIRNPKFIIGMGMGFIGVAGVTIDHPDQALIPTFNFATAALVAAAFGWAVYAVWGKHTVANRLHPVTMFAVVSLYTTLILGALSCCFGAPHTLLDAPGATNALALFSGILPIAIAHTSFHFSQKVLGSAFCAGILLLNPIITHFIALTIWKDEAMVWSQWLGAAILLSGSFLNILAERRVGIAQIESGQP